MFDSPAKPISRSAISAITTGVLAVLKVIYMAFISGPRSLITTQLSAKNASLMIMLSIPALLFCGMLTIPAVLFTSPAQNEYFYFAKILNHDPSRWLIFALAGACSFLALAMPANDQQSFSGKFAI